MQRKAQPSNPIQGSSSQRHKTEGASRQAKTQQISQLSYDQSRPATKILLINIRKIISSCCGVCKRTSPSVCNTSALRRSQTTIAPRAVPKARTPNCFGLSSSDASFDLICLQQTQRNEPEEDRKGKSRVATSATARSGRNRRTTYPRMPSQACISSSEMVLLCKFLDEAVGTLRPAQASNNRRSPHKPSRS